MIINKGTGFFFGVGLPVVHPLKVLQKTQTLCNYRVLIAQHSSCKTLWLAFIYNPCTVLTKDEGGSPLSECLLRAAPASRYSDVSLTSSTAGMLYISGAFTFLAFCTKVICKMMNCGLSCHCNFFPPCWNLEASCIQAHLCVIIKALSQLRCKNSPYWRGGGLRQIGDHVLRGRRCAVFG